MKKLITTFFILLLSLQNTYAEEECLIEDKMWDSLSLYIKNNDKILSKINWELQVENIWEENAVIEKFKKSYNSILSKVIWAYNSTFDFKNYFANIQLETEYPKNIEIPKEVKRDLEKLKKTWKKISKNMENIMKSWKDNIIIKDFCANFSEIDCDIPKEIRASDLIKKVMINYKNIESNLIYTLLWESSKLNTNITFVWDNFNSDLEEAYSPENFSKCNTKEWTFLDNALKKIEKTWFSTKYMRKGMKEWKDAWDLLVWKDMTKKEEEEVEDRLLREELSRQWITWDNQSNMLKNLEKYNSEWFSENNNFISNTFNSTKRKLQNKINDFKREKIWDFLKKEWENSSIDSKKTVSLNKSLDVKDNSLDSNRVKERIDKLYIELIPYTAISENKADNLRTRIINTHIEISNSINTLQETCKKAVKICNQQDHWNWDCGKCQ